MGGAEGRAGRGWAGPLPARRKAACPPAGAGWLWATDESAGRCSSWTSQPGGPPGGVEAGAQRWGAGQTGDSHRGRPRESPGHRDGPGEVRREARDGETAAETVRGGAGRECEPGV